MDDATQSRIVTVEERLDRLEETLQVNTSMTQEIRDILAAVKVGLRVLGAIGTIAKWVGGIAAAGTAIYVLIYQATHNGKLP